MRAVSDSGDEPLPSWLRWMFHTPIWNKRDRAVKHGPVPEKHQREFQTQEGTRREGQKRRTDRARSLRVNGADRTEGAAGTDLHQATRSPRARLRSRCGQRSASADDWPCRDTRIVSTFCYIKRQEPIVCNEKRGGKRVGEPSRPPARYFTDCGR